LLLVMLGPMRCVIWFGTARIEHAVHQLRLHAVGELLSHIRDVLRRQESGGVSDFALCETVTYDIAARHVMCCWSTDPDAGQP
jgi:hypothetical protein